METNPRPKVPKITDTGLSTTKSTDFASYLRHGEGNNSKMWVITEKLSAPLYTKNVFLVMSHIMTELL